MTATDELRRMLDERGVEWEDFDGEPTWTDGDGRMYYAREEFTFDGPTDKVTLYHITPAQAVDATLGRGACHVVSSIRHDYEGGYAGTEWEHELSCGHKVWWGNDDPPEWCPWCGAKVMDE